MNSFRKQMYKLESSSPGCIVYTIGATTTTNTPSTACPEGYLTSTTHTFTLVEGVALEEIIIGFTLDVRYVDTVQLPPGEQSQSVTIGIGQSVAGFTTYENFIDNGQGQCSYESATLVEGSIGISTPGYNFRT